MGTNVYANGDEICCKSADGKTTIAFPDTCWTPPTPPAGPLPVTYPNSASPSSLKKGSSTVRIKRSAIALTDRSYFSTSTGNEPATPALQKGLLTRKIKGKTYFKQWSMNVKVEGKGVCRNLDLMTHNHGGTPGNTAPFPFLDGSASGASGGDPCGVEKDAINEQCNEGVTEGENWSDKACSSPLLQIKPTTTNPFNSKNDPNPDSIVLSKALKSVGLNENAYTDLDSFADAQTEDAKNEDCLRARKCSLVRYDESSKKGSKGSEEGCCNGQTGHHVIPDAMASEGGCPGYDKNTAPVICVEGTSHHKGSHGDMHGALETILDAGALKKAKENLTPLSDVRFSMDEVINAGAKSVVQTFLDSRCSEKCIQAQLRSYYKDCSGKMKPVDKSAKVWGDKKQKAMQKELDVFGDSDLF